MDDVTMQRELDKMKLFEQKDVEGVRIQKVTGGWIYWLTAKRDAGEVSTSVSVSGVFVPEK